MLLKDQSYATVAQDAFLAAALMQALNSPSERVYALGLSQVDKVADENTATLRAMVRENILRDYCKNLQKPHGKGTLFFLII